MTLTRLYLMFDWISIFVCVFLLFWFDWISYFANAFFLVFGFLSDCIPLFLYPSNISLLIPIKHPNSYTHQTSHFLYRSNMFLLIPIKHPLILYQRISFFFIFLVFIIFIMFKFCSNGTICFFFAIFKLCLLCLCFGSRLKEQSGFLLFFFFFIFNFFFYFTLDFGKNRACVI